MDTILSFAGQAIAVIFVLGTLIFIHELGHFLMARYLKIGVITFSLGFGPKILKYTKDKTTYCLSLIPLGGYVSAVGEYSDEVESLGFTQEEAVTCRPPMHRLLLALAGPVANLILAFFFYWIIAFSAGSAVVLPKIGNVLDESAASIAGIQPSDTILRIGNSEVQVWDDIPNAIEKTQGRATEIEFLRDDMIYTVLVTPKESVRTNIFGEEEKAFLVGITPSGETLHLPLGLIDSFVEAYDQTMYTIKMTITGISKLVTGSVSADNVGGPILIAQIVGEQAKVGIIPLLMLAALISINLGLLNLLPIPVLDGGTIVFSIIEMIIRRPISENVQEQLMKVGGFFLISLMVFATFNDVMRFFK